VVAAVDTDPSDVVAAVDTNSVDMVAAVDIDTIGIVVAVDTNSVGVMVADDIDTAVELHSLMSVMSTLKHKIHTIILSTFTAYSISQTKPTPKQVC